MYVLYSKMSLHVTLPNDCFNFLIAETDSNHSLSLLIEAITVLFFLRYFLINALDSISVVAVGIHLMKCYKMESPCPESCTPSLKSHQSIPELPQGSGSGTCSETFLELGPVLRASSNPV